METHAIKDPFTGKNVEISDRLTDRLRGKYAVGPTLENGEPEFGWRQHQTPPIQHEAATKIEQLYAALESSVRMQSHYASILNMYDNGDRLEFENVDAWLARLQACADLKKAEGK